jgi:hypothetical protein
MSDLSPHEIGRLLEKVDNTERLIHDMSDRITRMEAQLNTHRGLGIGILIAITTVTASGASMLTKWLNS